jgi:hypothetical protein
MYCVEILLIAKYYIAMGINKKTNNILAEQIDKTTKTELLQFTLNNNYNLKKKNMHVVPNWQHYLRGKYSFLIIPITEYSEF